jgi:hypothetical protein
MLLLLFRCNITDLLREKSHFFVKKLYFFFTFVWILNVGRIENS